MKLQIAYCAACRRAHPPGDHAARAAPVTPSVAERVTPVTGGVTMPPIPLPAERNALPVGNGIAEWPQVQAAAAAFGMPVDAWISMAIEAMRAKAPPMSNAEKQRAYRERAKVRAMGDATNVKVGASDAN